MPEGDKLPFKIEDKKKRKEKKAEEENEKLNVILAVFSRPRENFPGGAFISDHC